MHIKPLPGQPSKQVTFTLTPEAYDKLNEQAFATKTRTVTEYVRNLVSDHLESLSECPQSVEAG